MFGDCCSVFGGCCSEFRATLPCYGPITFLIIIFKTFSISCCKTTRGFIMYIICHIYHANNQTHRSAHCLTIPVAVDHFIRRRLPRAISKGRFQIPKLSKPGVAHIEGHVDHDLPDLAGPGQTTGRIQALGSVDGDLHVICTKLLK